MRALFAALGLLAASRAHAGDLEEENRRLRDEVKALKASDPESALRKSVKEFLLGPRPEDMPRTPVTLEYQGGLTFRTEDGCHLLRLNLLLQTGYFLTRDRSVAHDQGESGFEVDMLRLRVSGHAWTDRLKYFLDLEFGPHARRFSAEADAVAEAWATYHRRDWQYLTFKGGRFRAAYAAGEQAADEALALCERGLVTEHFTVGRVDGIAILVSDLLFWDRLEVEIDLHSGSERFDPDVAFVGHDKRGAFNVRAALTLVGKGLPRTHLAYEGDPYQQPEGVLVIGAAMHFETSHVAGAPLTKIQAATADLTWRRRGRYASLSVFYGRVTTTAASDDWGVQFTYSKFVVPRRVEFAARVGYIDYGAVREADGDLIEATLGFSFYWLDETERPLGHRLRVNLDIGYAENVVTATGLLNWAAGHIEGVLFRSQLTVLF